MAEIYSTHYPIIHSFYYNNLQPINYQVLIGDKIIYTGRVHPYSLSEGKLDIDISDITQQWLNTFYEDLPLGNNFNTQVPTQGDIATIHTFTVRSDNNIKAADLLSGVDSSLSTYTGWTKSGNSEIVQWDGYNSLHITGVTDWWGVTATGRTLPANKDLELGIWVFPLSTGSVVFGLQQQTPTAAATIPIDSGMIGKWNYLTAVIPARSTQIDGNFIVFRSGGLNAYFRDVTATYEDTIGGVAKDQNYIVAYNYNTDYQSIIPDNTNLNSWINNIVDPRQVIFLSSLAYDTPSFYSWSVNNGPPVVVTGLTSTLYDVFSLDLSELTLKGGDILSLTSNNRRRDFTVVNNCHNNYCLYYVNKAGGLDFLLVNGQQRPSYKSTNYDITTYGDRSSRKDFHYKHLFEDISKEYSLQFVNLTDEGGELIDNLTFSPKVWIHNLEEDTITAVTVTTTTQPISSYIEDGVFTYTLTVRESQNYIRR